MTNEVTQKTTSDEQNVSSSNGLEPSLRFREFKENLPQIKLSKLFHKCTQKNKDGTITNVICNSAKNGLIPQRDFFDKDIANTENTAGYYIIKNNDFVYNPRKSNEAPYGPVSIYKYAEDGIVSPLYLCFRAINSLCADYFEMYFKSSAWHRYIYLMGDSGARHDRVSIKDEVFFDMPVRMPSLPEQEKIAAFLSLVDARIEKQRQLVEALKKYKRGLLSAIFDRKIRFKDNDGNNFPDWGLKTVADVLNYEQPQKYIVFSENYNDEYKTPVLTANKAFILGYTNEETGVYSKGETIIYDDFTMDFKFVDFRFKVKSSTIKMLTCKNFNDLYFMYNLLLSLNLMPQSHQRSYISILEPTKIFVPCYDEQLIISKVLRKVDSYFDQHNKYLDTLEKCKKGLLQQMFI